jgi:hypothetical protein
MTLRLTQLGTLGALIALSTIGSYADQARPKKPIAVAPKATNAPRIRPKSVGSRAVTSTTISELLAKDLTLQPGESKQLYAESDFSGTESVALGFIGPNDQDFTNTNYLVWWGPANAPSYVVSDYLQGEYFSFLNSGGSQVTTYGNELMIEVRNDGKIPVTFSQITAYAVAR